jgi:hypothetical protein
MAIAYAVAQPVVVDVSGEPPPAGGPAVTPVPGRRTLPTLGGWRVAWTTGGESLALGSPSAQVQDDAPPGAWRRVALDGTPEAAAPTDSAGGADLARVDWTEGPLLDISTPVAVAPARTVAAGEHKVESRDGWIRLVHRTADGGTAARVIGPGVVLAATAGARFVVALAPRLDAREYEVPLQTVVYQVIE